MNTTWKCITMFIGIAGIVCIFELQRHGSTVTKLTNIKSYLLQSARMNIPTPAKHKYFGSKLVDENSASTESGKSKLSVRDAANTHSPSCHRNNTDIVMFTTFINAPGRLELQRVVINNWSQYYPIIKCILFVNFTEQNISSDFGDLIKYSLKKNWTVLPITAVNNYGTPFLMPWFKLVITTVTAKLYGFVNGDNIFDDGLVDTLMTVIQLLPSLNDSVLVTGMRRDITWTPQLDGSPLWSSSRVREVSKDTPQPNPIAEDYFFVGRHFPYESFRNVVVGRLGVDNYLVLRAKELDIVTIDASLTITDVHIKPSEGRVHGGEAPDREFNYGVVGPVTWSLGRTDQTLMKTTGTENGTIAVVCRRESSTCQQRVIFNKH